MQRMYGDLINLARRRHLVEFKIKYSQGQGETLRTVHEMAVRPGWLNLNRDLNRASNVCSEDAAISRQDPGAQESGELATAINSRRGGEACDLMS